MVKPNMPRFVRVGDCTTISAKLTNAAGHDIEGKVVCELLNAKDEKVLFSESRNFTLEDGTSTDESFRFTPDEGVKDYICRIFAVGEGFSDGEQHLLQVMPDKAEVTVTHVISQDGPGKETVDTAALLPADTSRHELSFQYTNSPVWLAVKALPVMIDPDSDNAVSVAVSLYSNLLTDYLQRKMAEYGTLNLSDEKKLAKTTDKLIAKLKKLQGRGGGFCWYKRMPESMYLTAEVAMHLCRLQRITGLNDQLGDILEKALRFCDREMCDCVNWLKKEEAKGHEVYMPTFTVLQHMYNCAVAGRKLDNAAKHAYGYLILLLKKDIHRQTMFEKAMSALILAYAGEQDRAMIYCESMRQYMECDLERGMTFQTERATYSWYSYKIPTHVAALEVLHLLCPDDRKTISEMQKWLLNEKRTQMWETPIDCVNAVHALLIDVGEFMIERRNAEFYADGVRIDVPVKENEGMVETVLPADTQKLEVVKSSKGMSWGAVFAPMRRSSGLPAPHSGLM